MGSAAGRSRIPLCLPALFLGLCLVVAGPLLAEKAPAAAGTGAPKIDDFQRVHPEDPRAKPAQSPATTAGSTQPGKPLPGDAAQMRSPDDREQYVTSVQQALATWDERLAELDKKSPPPPATKILHTLRKRTDADLIELARVKGNAWLDVKARIEARFRRMEKEYRTIKS